MDLVFTDKIKKALKKEKIPLFEDIRIGKDEIEFFFSFNMITKIPIGMKRDSQLIDLLIAELNPVKKIDKIIKNKK